MTRTSTQILFKLSFIIIFIYFIKYCYKNYLYIDYIWNNSTVIFLLFLFPNYFLIVFPWHTQLGLKGNYQDEISCIYCIFVHSILKIPRLIRLILSCSCDSVDKIVSRKEQMVWNPLLNWIQHVNCACDLVIKLTC